MKNYYYNPKTRDLTIFDTETKEMLVMELLTGIHVLTQHEIDNPGGDEPVKKWHNSAWNPKTGKAGYGQKKLKKSAAAKKCGYCHSTEHRGKNCPNKPTGRKPKVKGTKVCKNCGEPGHMAKTCKNQPKVSPAISPEKLPDEEIEAIAREERKEEPLPD
ncbi:MAG TPA: hypothetical protein VGZ48_07325 [Candidatus Acidoferrales bacterium]|jgi:hypothetical protein|nr:hypothetical protein [Candidatus Acidoferrales bacterium]